MFDLQGFGNCNQVNNSKFDASDKEAHNVMQKGIVQEKQKTEKKYKTETLPKVPCEKLQIQLWIRSSGSI